MTKFIFWLRIISICCLIYPSINTPLKSTEETSCFDCQGLNRKLQTLECDDTEKDCGGCLAGFSQRMDSGRCYPDGQTVIDDGQHEFIQRDATVIINCHFDREVDCTWRRRGQYVEMGGRYHFQNNDGVSTTDCSIKIDDFGEIDQGKWSCETYANALSGGLKSTKAWLILKQDACPIIVKGRETAQVPAGTTVYLPCQFSEEVHCSWRRAGNYVDIGDRYTFIDNRNGEGTKDCSIQIQDFKEIDVGKWECRSLASANEPAITKTSQELKLVTKGIEYEKVPRDQTVKLGDNVRLECQFNCQVKYCNWKRNGQQITVTDRYQYLNQNNGHHTRNCGIEISDVKVEDLGSWTCEYVNQVVTTKPIKMTAKLSVQPQIRTTNILPELTCAATKSYPAAKIHWILNGDHIYAENIVENNGLFDSYSTLTINPKKTDSIKCIIEHTTFSEPRQILIQFQASATKKTAANGATAPNSGTTHSFKMEMTSFWIVVGLLTSILNVLNR